VDAYHLRSNQQNDNIALTVMSFDHLQLCSVIPSVSGNVRIISDTREGVRRIDCLQSQLSIVDDPSTMWITIFSLKLKMIVSSSNETWFEHNL